MAKDISLGRSEDRSGGVAGILVFSFSCILVMAIGLTLIVEASLDRSPSVVMPLISFSSLQSVVPPFYGIGILGEVSSSTFTAKSRSGCRFTFCPWRSRSLPWDRPDPTRPGPAASLSLEDVDRRYDRMAAASAPGTPEASDRRRDGAVQLKLRQDFLGRDVDRSTARTHDRYIGARCSPFAKSRKVRLISH